MLKFILVIVALSSKVALGQKKTPAFAGVFKWLPKPYIHKNVKRIVCKDSVGAEDGPVLEV